MQKINSGCQRKHINEEEQDRKAENVIFQSWTEGREIAEFRDSHLEWGKNR